MRKKGTPRREMIRVIALSVAVSLVLWLSLDIIINFSYSKVANRPEADEGSSLVHQLLYYMENPAVALADNVVINEDYIIAALTPAKIYIEGRYDCSDFRMQSLMRLQYLYGREIRYISPDAADMLKNIFIGAKYWMTEPGVDSMCFWSENHQILFAVSEYLAGQEWPDEVFTNDGTTGREHMARARNRINYWMEYRFTYGFSEFNSNNYYHMNIAPAANFIQFASADDKDMVDRMKMCLDLLFYDVATNMHNYVFLAPSGRMYAGNMVGVTGDRLRQFTDYIWGLNDDYKTSTHHMFLSFLSMMEAKDSEGERLNLYQVPEVILEIGGDNGTRVTKSSNGLNVSELAELDLIGHSDKQIMIQLGMEAFTNPEVIQNTLTYFSKYNMMNNSFVNDFKYINLSLIKTLHLAEPISRTFNPMPNGIALQRANIYSYRTEYYKLATAQAYHPGSYGAQQMLSIANLTDKAVVFTTHPAKFETLKTAKEIPGYWAGYGRAPHSAQHENILISIYQLPSKSGFLELYDVPQFTHTYFPEAFFDEVIIDGRYAFGRIGNAYISLTGASDLTYKPYSADSASVLSNGLDQFPDKRFDLIQNGLNQYWIYEMSDIGAETFQDFILRIKSNNVTYNGVDSISYTSSNTTLSLDFMGDFKINGTVEDLEYKRYDSDYITANRNSSSYLFSFNGKTLTLDYNNLVRDMT